MKEKNLTVFLITLGIVLLTVFRGLPTGDIVLGDVGEYTLFS